jgi:hypothetical protein
MGRATWKKVSGTWRQVANVWRKDSGSWQNGVIPYIHAGGVWEQCIETPPASSFIVDGGGFTVSGANCDYANGTVSFNGATCPYDITELTIQVRVIHYIMGVVATVNFYMDAYNADDDIGYMSNVVYGPPIQGYGYTVRLEFNESA